MHHVLNSSLERPGEQTDSSLFRVTLGASLGTLFEWYEFALYGSLASVVAKQFFAGVDPVTGFVLALLTFAVGFMARPIGAMIFGHVGDQIGRKKTFLITIMLMGLATVAVGFLPTYEAIGVAAPITLVTLRILQGIAAGGEYTGAMTYVAECAPKGRRGFWMSWTAGATTAALGLSFLVIMAARSIAGADFDKWGWRLPFLFSAVLLTISLVVRMKMQESPAFERAKQLRQLSSAPLKEALTDPVNIKRMLVAFIITSGMTSMYYVACLYPTFFLVQLVKADPGQVNYVAIIATAAATFAFPLSGWICDRIGRKASLLASFVVSIAMVFPVFHALTASVSPDLVLAQANTPVVLSTHPDECSLLFNPTGTRKFTSGCDVAKQALANAGVSYKVETRGGAGTLVRIGAKEIEIVDAAELQGAVNARSEQFNAALHEALSSAGYPAKADPAKFNITAVFAILTVFFAANILAVAALAPALVEMFPTRTRYTSMSLPWSLAAGWVGGLLPTMVFAISAQSGDIYSGLWYPVFWAVAAIAATLWGYRETKGTDLAAI